MQSNSYDSNIRNPESTTRNTRLRRAVWQTPWRLSKLVVLAFTAFLLAATAEALEGSGRLSGLVTDPNGSAVPGISVRAVNTDTGLQYDAVTNPAGLYVYPALPM